MKVCVITGGNAGIGRATALSLAQSGAHVVLVGRDEASLAEACDDIRGRRVAGRVDFKVCDLRSMQQVRKLAARLLEELPEIHVLLNNAGIVTNRYAETEDGFELHWGVNHLSHFLLTHLLLDRIKASAPARIINVSSAGHRKGRIALDADRHRRGYSGPLAYGQSKLAGVLITYELARRLEGSGVTVNALHPGGVRTDIVSKSSTGVIKVIWKLLQPFLISVEAGAETSVYLASSSEVEGVTGKYFEKCRPVSSSALSCDLELARKVWDISMRDTALVSREPEVATTSC